MDTSTTKRWMGWAGVTATVAAAVAVGVSGASQAEPDIAPPGPVTTPEMTTAETTVDLAPPEGTQTPTVATPPVTATTTEAG